MLFITTGFAPEETTKRKTQGTKMIYTLYTMWALNLPSWWTSLQLLLMVDMASYSQLWQIFSHFGQHLAPVHEQHCTPALCHRHLNGMWTQSRDQVCMENWQPWVSQWSKICWIYVGEAAIKKWQDLLVTILDPNWSKLLGMPSLINGKKTSQLSNKTEPTWVWVSQWCRPMIQKL